MHKYLKQAHIVATRGNRHRKAFVGAVGRRADGTLVVAWNGTAQGTSYDQCPQAHAEVRLARKLDWGSVVYVARAKRCDGSMAIARPCANCERVLRNKGVRRVEYTINENEFGVMEF